MKTKNYRKDRVEVITLGCSKNLVDSEELMGQLEANDFKVSHESGKENANIVIINTCGFIDRAKEESIETILEYAAEKKAGRIERLLVTGCLSQRYRDDLKKEIPEVDDWFGTMELPLLLERLQADYKHELLGERVSVTPSHYAYLKISEGCNRTCAFCAIPLMRGAHRSKSIEALVKEARFLARNGTRELILIAQELSYYGLDIYKERALARLLRALAGVEGIEWIRLHYAYPGKFPLDVLDVMREEEKVLPYLDMPLQHASDPVLKRMRRQITRKETEQLLDSIRAKVPGIHIRTTLLVGFPGESEEDFEELMDFVQAQQFERLGVFTYSHEENTAAYELQDDVPQELKEERAARLMELQSGISFEKNKAKIGTVQRVLFDRKEGDWFIGRTAFDSPEVDNEVLVDAKNQYLRIGDFADIVITDANEFDLYGKLKPIE